jgi:hypothetical protein
MQTVQGALDIQFVYVLGAASSGWKSPVYFLRFVHANLKRFQSEFSG